MVVRENFQLALESLDEKVVELGSMAVKTIVDSIEALKNQNVELALKVIDNDVKIDLLEEEINDMAILLIAKQAPVAIDLRRIIVAIKIATDIERVADFSVNIAKSTIRIGENPYNLSINPHIEMAEIAQEMLSLAMESYKDEDVVKAKALADLDDQVDEIHGKTIQQLMQKTVEDNHIMLQSSQLMFVSRYIERMCDHITNIAESIFYLVKGKRYDLND